VVTNDEAVSYQAVKHLIDHGRRKIGLVTIPVQASNTADRVAGYRRALEEYNCYNPTLIREVDVIGHNAFDLALDLLANTDIDAMFTTSQSTALGVLRAANRLGRRIPDDLALYGYDDVPWMEAVASPLSTICQPVERMAQLATQILLECIEGTKPCNGIYTVESSLVIRNSCGCS
jgi:LacI family transcriptional regulator